MNPDREWTAFALEAETDEFGCVRVAKWGNDLRAEVARLTKQLAEQTAACSCGCPEDAHSAEGDDDVGCDGSCGQGECLPCSIAVAELLRVLREAHAQTRAELDARGNISPAGVEVLNILGKEMSDTDAALSMPVFDDDDAAHAERLARIKSGQHAEAVVAQLQWFIEQERAHRDAVGKGGQHCNGSGPRITPTVLRDLERMVRDAPDVAAGYAKAEARADHAEAVLRGLRSELESLERAGNGVCSADALVVGHAARDVLAKLDELEREQGVSL